MKAIVIGLGSMGKRRIWLLRRHKEMEIVGIDSNEERCAEVSEEYGIECSRNLDECFQDTLRGLCVCLHFPSVTRGYNKSLPDEQSPCFHGDQSCR